MCDPGKSHIKPFILVVGFGVDTQGEFAFWVKVKLALPFPYIDRAAPQLTCKLGQNVGNLGGRAFHTPTELIRIVVCHANRSFMLGREQQL